MALTERNIKNFWKHVDKSDGCWEWTGWCFGDKYGCFRKDGKKLLAHRVSYEIHHGDPVGGVVMHICDNPKCVNPDHLLLGTQQKNITDMVEKGRKPKGERCSFAKLDKNQVAFIKAHHKVITQKKLAVMFGVSKSAIQQIHDGNNWKEV